MPVRLRNESGFTIVEVLVGLVILVVGIFGVISMVEGASRATSLNKSREAATGLTREMTETIRSVHYQSLSDAQIVAELQTRASLADASPAPGYTIARRNRTYTVSVTSCAMDDAKDGGGPHDGTVAFCPDSAPADTVDRSPDDYRRITLEVAWTSDGEPKTMRHSLVVSNPAGGFGPSVNSLNASPTTVTSETSTIQFTGTTSSTPATVNWSVNGDVRGQANVAGTTFSFSWDVSSVVDGAYVVHAQAFDSKGRAGVAYERTVTLDRRVPAAPSGFAGGRNGLPGHVDLEWHASVEHDVVGYRVYRSDAAGNKGTRACPPSSAGTGAVVSTSSCIDTGASLLLTQRYVLVAVDAHNEGTTTGVLSAPLGNLQPVTPLGVQACLGGVVGCVGTDGLEAPASTTVVSWSKATDLDGSVAFYRIYRDGLGYDDRYDRLYASGAATERYIDRNTGGQVHTYYVTAVDEDYGESALSTGVIG